ncbi:hypothetical protein TUMEXPCC7403_11320 [Tumidithrix helvetica PCC 7403]
MQPKIRKKKPTYSGASIFFQSQKSLSSMPYIDPFLFRTAPVLSEEARELLTQERLEAEHQQENVLMRAIESEH